MNVSCRLGRLFFAEVAVRATEFAGIRIEQFREAWILCQILEVGIVARLEPQLGIQAKGFVQMLQRVLDVARETVERGQSVNHVVGLGILFEELVEVLAGGYVIANIHQRDGEVKMFLRCLELSGYRAFQMLVTDAEMNVGAVDQFFAGAGNDLLKMRLRLVELVLLHGAQSGFVALQRLRVTGIFRYGLLRGGFLSHVQNSSCGLGNGELLESLLTEQ